ncbi:methyltransferase domain-containing protein [Streptomyces sp. MP131-18]|uniref:methyltransferase domain-containing protein n=1 Tax=Streptomyces sp. MP131-18 TaxID=1857892 RepID=UPI00097C50D5|nr:methyltransferase domain-containing protein [Streptomyces sp. MP131-18]ONK16000.1 Methyltransferase domain protein [Streptomyces sp. MP131-18]
MTGPAWDACWSTLPAAPGAALWDSSPQLTAARHLPLFRDHADPLLPLVDIGCGNGRQTQWLAPHFRRVIGLDIAESAVELAAASAAGCRPPTPRPRRSSRACTTPRPSPKAVCAAF